MFFQLLKDFLSAWSTKAKLYVGVGLFAVFCALIAAVVYFHSQNTVLKVENKQASTVITTQASTIENDKAAEKANNQAQASNNNTKQEIAKKSIAREDTRRTAEAALEKKYSSSQPGSETAAEDREKAAIAIDAVWSAYCTADPDDQECKNPQESVK